MQSIACHLYNVLYPHSAIYYTLHSHLSDAEQYIAHAVVIQKGAIDGSYYIETILFPRSRSPSIPALASCPNMATD